jgi:hypothetical protein
MVVHFNARVDFNPTAFGFTIRVIADTDDQSTVNDFHLH